MGLEIVSLLEDLNPALVSGEAPTGGGSGRGEFSTAIISSLAAHPEIERFTTSSRAVKKSILAARTPADGVHESPLVWLEPARHYYWRPSLIRRLVRGGFPIVTMAHGIGYPDQLMPMLASAAAVSRPGDTVIVPSRASRDVLDGQLRAYRELLGVDPATFVPDIEVVPYGVPPVTPVDRGRARRRLVANSDETVILFLGRLDFRDKADFVALLQATARVMSFGHRVRLVVAGFAPDPGFHEVFTRMVDTFGLGRAVDLRSNVTDTVKHDLLAACDIFVSPSNTTSESFGLCLVEAMMHGKPVVCTDWSGYREIVKDGETGFLVETVWNRDRSVEADLDFVMSTRPMGVNVAVDVEGLARGMAFLIEHPDTARAFGEAGRVRAHRNFTLDHACDRIVDVLHASLDSAGKLPPADEEAPLLPAASLFSRYAAMTTASDDILDVHAASAGPHHRDILAALRANGLSARRFLDVLNSGQEIRSSDPGAWHMLRLGLLTVRNNRPERPTGATELID